MGSIAEGSTYARLIETNEEFRTLSEQHSEYDHRLDEISSRRFPTTDDEVEEHRLKKRKLRTKDRMQAILREHEAQG